MTGSYPLSSVVRPGGLGVQRTIKLRPSRGRLTHALCLVAVRSFHHVHWFTVASYASTRSLMHS